MHELGDIGQCAPSGGNLSLEKFELPSAPLDAVPATIFLDVTALRHGVAHLAETEGLGERDNLAFLLVYPNAHSLKPAHNLPGQLLQFLNVRQDDVVIIHVMAGHMDAGLALDPVVNAAGERNHFLLGRFHAERHPTPRHRARGGGDDLVCQGPNSRVEDELPMPFIERRVRGIWKKPLQV